MSLDPRDEALAVKLNRVFAAANSLRDRRPEGYAQACRQLAELKQQLIAEPARAPAVMERVRELSGGTFDWEP